MPACDLIFVHFSCLLLFCMHSSVCPSKSAILWMIIGIVVGILLVGLVLLLIWRLLTYIHDRREFNQFEKERENARWEAVSHTNSNNNFFACFFSSLLLFLSPLIPTTSSSYCPSLLLLLLLPIYCSYTLWGHKCAQEDLSYCG